jgi:hypothetical protein
MKHTERLCFLKNIVTNPNIIVGDYTYYDDPEDVEPYAIVGGNPSKLIRKRFDDKTINNLIKLAWWDWSIEKIKQHGRAITRADKSLFE